MQILHVKKKISLLCFELQFFLLSQVELISTKPRQMNWINNLASIWRRRCHEQRKLHFYIVHVHVYPSVLFCCQFKEVQSLKQEIELLRNLQHPRIVQYFGCLEENGTLSIFMEFMSGVCIIQILKALFNYVFTFKNLSCMSLHAIIFFIRCTNEALEKLYLKSTSKVFKEVKIDKWPDLSCSFLPIDCCV